MAATSEILRVISSSPGELQTVFQVLLGNALRLCVADFGLIFQIHGSGMKLMAHRGASRACLDYMRRGLDRPGPDTLIAQVIKSRAAVQFDDYARSQAYLDRDPLTVMAVERGGVRTILGVPMLREGELIGAISLYRKEVHSFTDRQIELLQSFAAQGVIAIENTRLLHELRAVVAAADRYRRCAQDYQSFHVRSADRARYAHRVRGAPMRGGHGLHRAPARRTFHILIQLPFSAVVRRSRAGDARQGGPRHPCRPRFGGRPRRPHTRQSWPTRSTSSARARRPRLSAPCWAYPLLRGGTAIGVIILTRLQARPFTEKQIELVTTFADQAVIAIENVRLFEAEQQRARELSKSLEQQTATSEVLRVISSSPGDLEPVFQTMLQNAARICEAKAGNIYRWEDAGLRLVTSHNAPPAFAEMLRRVPLRATANNPVGRMLKTKTLVHTADLAAQQPYIEKSDPAIVAAVDLGKVRTQLSVPLLKEDEFIGAITLWRDEIRPFEAKQIELVQNFAAQAVIAIENARLLKANCTNAPVI